MNRVILITIILLFGLYANAQEEPTGFLQNQTDLETRFENRDLYSYRKVYNNQQVLDLLNSGELSLKQEMEAYIDISAFYSSFDMDSTYKYGIMGLELARKAKDERMIALLNQYVLSSYVYRGVYDTAHIYIQENFEIAKKNQDVNLFQQTYFGYASLCGRQGRFSQAIDNYLLALSYYEGGSLDSQNAYSMNSDDLYILTLSNIGECYRRLNNLERALFYLTKAKETIEENFERYGVGYYAATPVYRELGTVYFMLGDVDKALEYQLRVIAESSKFNQPLLSDSKQALIQIYIHKKEYDKALQHAHDCLELGKSLGDPYIDIHAWNAFSVIYREQGRYKESEAAAMKAWSLDSTSMDNAPVSAFNIAYANAFLGNKEKADLFFKKQDALIQERSNKHYQESVADMEVRYETDKKEMRITSLEKEKELYTWLGVVGILLLFALVIVLLQQIYNARKKKQLIATRAVLDGEMGERMRLSRDLHDRLSGSLSALKIALSNNKDVSLDIVSRLNRCIDEVRQVSHNLMPTSLRFGLKVALGDFAAQFPNVHFHFFGEDNKIDDRTLFVSYCCAIELINNSLRHSDASVINVQLLQDKKRISLIVQDDGVGFDENKITEGLGLKSVYDRVASCNGKIDIATSPGNGTETIIELKVKTKNAE